MKASQADSNGTNLEKSHSLTLFVFLSEDFSSRYVGFSSNIKLLFKTHDSYELLPTSLTGLGGVERLELLFEPRLCRGEPSRLQSWKKISLNLHAHEKSKCARSKFVALKGVINLPGWSFAVLVECATNGVARKDWEWSLHNENVGKLFQFRSKHKHWRRLHKAHTSWIL